MGAVWKNAELNLKLLGIGNDRAKGRLYTVEAALNGCLVEVGIDVKTHNVSLRQAVFQLLEDGFYDRKVASVQRKTD